MSGHKEFLRGGVELEQILSDSLFFPECDDSIRLGNTREMISSVIEARDGVHHISIRGLLGFGEGGNGNYMVDYNDLKSQEEIKAEREALTTSPDIRLGSTEITPTPDNGNNKNNKAHVSWDELDDPKPKVAKSTDQVDQSSQNPESSSQSNQKSGKPRPKIGAGLPNSNRLVEEGNANNTEIRILNSNLKSGSYEDGLTREETKAKIKQLCVRQTEIGRERRAIEDAKYKRRKEREQELLSSSGILQQYGEVTQIEGSDKISIKVRSEPPKKQLESEVNPKKPMLRHRI